MASKTIGILTNVFCISDPNIVILAWMDKQVIDTHIHRHTDS